MLLKSKRTFRLVAVLVGICAAIATQTAIASAATLSLSVTSGPHGLQHVNMTGSGFTPNATSSNVGFEFADHAGTTTSLAGSFVVDGSGNLTFNDVSVPSDAVAGLGSVSSAGGFASDAATTPFTVVPTVLSLSTTSGPHAFPTLTITGSGYSPNADASVLGLSFTDHGGTSTTLNGFSVDAGGHLTLSNAMVPATAVAGLGSVSTNGGNPLDVATTPFTVDSPVLHLSRVSGPHALANLNVSGSGFTPRKVEPGRNTCA